MKTSKFATKKAIAFAQGFTKDHLSIVKTTWEKCYDIIAQARNLYIDAYMHCGCEGDYSKFTWYNDKDYSASYNIPNSECWNEKEADWDWNYVYKTIIEGMMRSKKAKGAKKTEKAIKKVAKTTGLINVTELMKEVAMLKVQIKDATGSKKKSLINDYNNKSKLLQAQLDHNNEILDAQAAQKKEAGIPESKEAARTERQKVYMKIHNMEKRGKVVPKELQDRLEYLKDFIKNYQK